MSSSSSTPASSASSAPPSAEPVLDRIGLFGLPQWAAYEQIGKKLADAGVVYDWLVKKKGQMYAYVHFKTEDEITVAIAKLDAAKDEKGKPAFRFKRVAGDPEFAAKAKKRQLADAEDGGTEKKAKGMPAPNKPLPDSVADIVTSFWRKPYDQQLRIKQRDIEQLLRKLRRFMSEYRDIDFVHSNTKGKPLLCPCLPILPSPVLTGYRNKIEFSVGKDRNGRLSVGFILGRYAEGLAVVESAEQCPNVPPVALHVADIMRAYFEASGHAPYDKATHGGVWRLLVIRTAEERKELMINLQMKKGPLSDEQVQAIKRGLVEHLLQHFDSQASAKYGYSVHSIGLQVYDQISNRAPENLPYEVLHGSEYINEVICGLTFRVSANSFFQVNTRAAERLYNLVHEWAHCGDKTTLLDICCGTGTIGLCMAKRVGKVVGLEIVEAAVRDAEKNAANNDIKNAVYLCGKAEHTLPKALAEQALSSDIVAVVDPPRGGLHFDVVKALRKNQAIKRVVYVSCNPSSLAENVKRFLHPPNKNWKGEAFVAVKAIPVDLFPHTEHCEMVMLLERRSCVPPELFKADAGPAVSQEAGSEQPSDRTPAEASGDH